MASSRCWAKQLIREMGDHKCSHHRSKNVVFVCETCNELACVECVSSIHKNHTLADISKSMPFVKLKIQKYATSAEKDAIPRIEANIKQWEGNWLRKRQHYINLIIEIQTQNDRLKSEIDEAINGLMKTCCDMKDRCDDTFDKYERDLQAMIDELNAQINDCNSALRSTDNVWMFDISTCIPYMYQFEDIPNMKSCRLYDSISQSEEHREKWLKTSETLKTALGALETVGVEFMNIEYRLLVCTDDEHFLALEPYGGHNIRSGGISVGNHGSRFIKTDVINGKKIVTMRAVDRNGKKTIIRTEKRILKSHTVDGVPQPLFWH